MADTMRGVYTNLTEIRRKVFREVARIAYQDRTDEETGAELDRLPYDIIPGEVATYRESIFLERAIVAQRIRLAMGLSLQDVDQPDHISAGLEAACGTESYYEPPLINIIKFACNGCQDNVYKVGKYCQGCLAHPCREICPKGAISFKNKKALIDQEKCIKCGRCFSVCPYHAIHHHTRPCSDACGMDAIRTDEHGRADIDYDKCVSCGQCLVNCPFGAIADKSQIFQVIRAIRAGEEVIAAVAPAFVGQYGGKGEVGKLRAALVTIGFSSVEEVALGADLCTIQEAHDFMDEVPDKLPFMATSCCPAWAAMAKKEFPEQAECISMALTPMVLTARLIKSKHPNARVAFIGPCAAKKLEARRRTIRSEVDFVLTFEEVQAMLDTVGVEYTKLEPEDTSDFQEASEDGRSFAVAGGVAQAVVNLIKDEDPDREVKVESAHGLRECRALLKKAAKGAYDGYLLEGMGCPGGCVAGAGTLRPIQKSTAMVKMYAKRAPKKNANENSYSDELKHLIKE